ncbi:MAG: TonB-dependent receptor domain-containing protein [Rhodothermia bacterium]
MIDSTGAPLPGVNVVIQELKVGAASDVDGRFRIANLDSGRYTVVYSAVGFRTARLTVEIGTETDVFVRVVLEEISFLSNEIIVTASRRAQLSSSVPASYSLINAHDLEVRNIVALDQILRYVPGVQVMENQVNIRGSSGYSYNVGSRVLLLLDGVPLLTPDSDGVPFEALPFNQTEQIEIIKGPGSALWGSGALGGVINVVTKDFPEEPTTMARVFSGVHEPVSREDWLEKWPEGRDPRPFWSASVSHARRVGKKFGFWFNADYRDDRGYANMKTERFAQLYAKIGWKPARTTAIDILIAGLSRRKENFLFWNGLDDALNPGIPTIGGAPNARGVTDVQTDQLTIAPSIRQVISDRVLLHAKLRAFGTRIEGVNDDETGSGNVTHGFRYGGELQLNWTPSAARNVVLGVAGDANSTQSPFFVTSVGDLIGNQPELAAFGQYEDALGHRVRVVAGMRYSAYRVTTTNTVDNVSPKLALSYLAGTGVTLRASFGQGFRVPSLPERFIDDQAFVPLFPNFELLPEESTSFEIGVRWDSGMPGGGSFRLDAAGFWNAYDRLIEPKFTRISGPGEPLVVGFKFVNLRRARIIGLETSIDIALPAGIGSAYAGYTYMNSEDLDENLPLPFRPEHLFTTGIEARIVGPVEMGADFRVASAPERLDSDFALFVPGSDVWIATRALDYWAAVTFSSVRLSLHAKNVFDYYYVERPAFLAAPRLYFVQLRFDF